MSKKGSKRRTAKMSLFFILCVTLIIIATLLLVFAGCFMLVFFGVVSKETIMEQYGWVGLVIVGAVTIVGIGLSGLVSTFFLKPFNRLLSGMDALAKGEFDTRIDIGGYESMVQISDGFNSMAKELEKTRILRNDFVNNFSHEFKTPIASVMGLLDLLEREDIPDEKRRTYLNIIREEIDRLFNMSTRMLALSNIENQYILKDVERFNLSEQIRKSILLLAVKWEKKEIEFDIDIGEHEIYANRELLEHVWLNLIDNAIKFSNKGGIIGVKISADSSLYTIDIINYGDKIPEDEITKIFNKFYRSDSSHTREGNGIGLSIVKHIVEMHNGSVEARNTPECVLFSVKIPCDSRI